MESSNCNAVYNARIPPMLISLCLQWLTFALSLSCTLAASGSPWHSPAQELARKIAATTGPGAVSIDIVNRSSLGRAEVEKIRRGLLFELAALGTRPVSPDQAAAAVVVTLSESLQTSVWVAQIHQGSSEPTIVMVSVPRSDSAVSEHQSVQLTIRKTLLWADENRILDIAIVNGNPQHMIILEAESIVFYKLQAAHWQREESFPVSHLHPSPRDLRGRLVLRRDHLFDAYLPGIFCHTATYAPLTVNCHESEDPWPIGTEQFPLSAFFTTNRNFFTGALSPGVQQQKAVLPFYSAVALSRDKYTLWVLTAVDGPVHLFDGVTDVKIKIPWGSDIAGVRSSCGLGQQILAAGVGDGATDTVTAFEVPDREPIAVSQPTEFAGNITALWTESNGSSVIAVSQDPETGRYEAYQLSIDCGQ